ncbi:MAG: AMP-binding protein [Nitrososphaerota archaeon]|nr:AMP-binding protein [Nitrososphaerota archaeon]
MDSEIFTIGLGKNDSDTRKKSDFDFISFWNEQAKNLSWFSPWTKTLDWNPPFGRWFVGGTLNASYNALDIHQNTRSQKPAILWEGENGDSRTLTYNELLTEVQKFSNVLKSLGLKKGDRVTIYLPMVPELPISMLACARIGVTHTVVFSGFSSKALKDRIDDSKSKIVITADGGYRRGSVVKLKSVVDDAIQELDCVQNVIVFERTKISIKMNPKVSIFISYCIIS